MCLQVVLQIDEMREFILEPPDGTQSALERCPCIRRVATGPPKPRLPAALPHQQSAGGKMDRRPKCHVSFSHVCTVAAAESCCMPFAGHTRALRVSICL